MGESAHGEASRVEPGKLTALLKELAATPREPAACAWEAVLHRGARVGRFELVREIGRGGFGVVWEALDGELGRSVALKAVRAGGNASLREERLALEAEAAARLAHPNLVTLHDVGRTEQGPYLVLELLRGETLEERLATRPPSVREALHIGIEVAKGVAHAHARGVVHRDLKPANVFLCDDGQVKVLDFGLAHAFGRRRADGGTSGYMAPEQLEGAPEDERTDVFALGVLLYRMLSGDPEFPPAAVGRAPPPELEVLGVASAGPFVQRMLAQRATERPRNGGEVLAALAGFAAELERAGTGPPPVRTRRRRGKLAVLAAAAVAAAVLVGATTAWLALQRTAPAPKPSVAVLPFADLSPEHDQAYFADGVAEEIMSALARVDGLRVPGRTSSFYFRGKDVELAEIGRKLGVAHVLEGSVRKAGDRVRITAKLLDVTSGDQLWSGSFEGSLTRVFDFQDELSRTVAQALQVKLLTDRADRGAPPVGPEAYAQYLRGRDLFYTGYLENVERAVKHFERAVALAPDYAPAWARLSFAIAQVDIYAGRTTAESQRGARDAAEKAIALAPDDGIGYLARAFLRNLVLWEFDGALSDVEKALTLKKGHLQPYNQHSLVLRTFGRFREAIAASRAATEMDPLNAVYWANLGRAYVAAGELDLAKAAFDRGLELSPGRWLYDVAVVELLRGSPAVARSLLEQLPPGDSRRLAGIAMAEHDLGRTAEARRALKELVDGAPGEPYLIAIAHAWIGLRDEAFPWLQRAYDQRDLGLSGMKQDSRLLKLRDDPRYAELLRKMKLPVE